MTLDTDRDAVLLVNFGEPEEADPDAVVDFLERIFLANAALEDPSDPMAAARRSRQLAERRAPGLLEDYRRIGGSPLAAQAREQADGLARALERRGAPVTVELGMQFTEPSIPRALETLAGRGVERIVAFPVYPLCGPSTTVQALTDIADALHRMDWSPEVTEITGWHRHPRYVRVRAEAIRETAAEAGLDPASPEVELVFSAHGTPLRYVEAGSRYVDYVEDWCARLAKAVGVEGYTLGYQNHANRDIAWTPPDIEAAVEALGGREALLVDAVSFVHEQSETLVELDIDLRERVEERGAAFHRVPIPYATDAFCDVLADLVELAAGSELEGTPPLRSCRCRPGAGVCFNGEPAA